MRARTGRRRLAAAVVGVGVGVIAAGTPALAADRAYELVTPPDSWARALPGTGASTADGNVVCYDAEDAAAGSQVNGILVSDGFCSWRTASGWETKWVTGPPVSDPKGGNGSAVFRLSSDGRRVAFATDKGIYPDYPGGGPDGSAGNVATQSAFLWEGGDLPRWLSPAPEPLPESLTNLSRLPLAASDDLGRGIFMSSLRLVPQDTNDLNDVYEWTPNGTRLVSSDASGAAVGGGVPPFDTLAGSTPNGELKTFAQPGALSRDGSRIFFNSAAASLPGSTSSLNTVYMREGGDVTLVSPRRGGDVPAEITFAGASDDGAIVYLQTTERLTPEPNEAGVALYRYEIATDSLSLVATDPNGVFFLGLSADGSTVVYRTANDFASELRIWRDGVETRVGALDFMDMFSATTIGSKVGNSRGLRITPDGSVVVFSAVTGFDETPGGTTQVYRWTPAQGVRRISTTGDGSAPAAGADIGNWSTTYAFSPRAVGIVNNMRGYPLLGRVFTDDGRVFFETAEPLVPEDLNEYIDVYEWQDGTVRLVTPGTQDSHAVYHDSSADGNTVFFTTSARVIPELDRNTSLDLYAARVGGGFPLTPRTPACEGDRCQAPPTPPPASQVPGSTVFDGHGDAQEAEPPVARHRVLRITARQRRAFARRGQIVLRVRANERGVVTATSTARIGRRTVRVARSVAAVRNGATVRVRLDLSRRARRALSDNRRLRVAVSVRYSESDTTIRRTVMLRG